MSAIKSRSVAIALATLSVALDGWLLEPAAWPQAAAPAPQAAAPAAQAAPTKAPDDLKWAVTLYGGIFTKSDCWTS